jgi:hypothetical protein
MRQYPVVVGLPREKDEGPVLAGGAFGAGYGLPSLLPTVLDFSGIALGPGNSPGGASPLPHDGTSRHIGRPRATVA